MSEYPFDDATCPDYARGFRAGVDAAVECVYRRTPDTRWATDLMHAIRSLSPPSPEPATRRESDAVALLRRFAASYWSQQYVDPKIQVAVSDFLGMRPAGGPTISSSPAPAPGPERCGHRDITNVATEGVIDYTRCDRCGAEWRDDGQGWRRP